jgi:hypothetical protein
LWLGKVICHDLLIILRIVHRIMIQVQGQYNTFSKDWDIFLQRGKIKSELKFGILTYPSHQCRHMHDLQKYIFSTLVDLWDRLCISVFISVHLFNLCSQELVSLIYAGSVFLINIYILKVLPPDKWKYEIRNTQRKNDSFIL